MRWIGLLFLGMGYLFAQPVANNKFTPLFNGKNFDGWFLKLSSNDKTLIPKTYGIHDSGWVHITKDLPDNYHLNTGENDTYGMMFTNKRYSHYVLKWEYKWGTKKMNSFETWQYDGGVFYHNQNEGIFPAGIEYQVRYNHFKNKNHTGDVITTSVVCKRYTKNGWSFEFPENGGVGKMAAPNTGLEAMAGVPFHALNNQWNKCELIVMGKEYALYKLNGKIVNYITDLSVGEGTFGFQSETSEIFYRNIELMETATVIPYSETKKDSFATTGLKLKSDKFIKVVSNKIPVLIEKGSNSLKLTNYSGKKATSKVYTSKGNVVAQQDVPSGNTSTYSLLPGTYALEIELGKEKSVHVIHTGK
jgi:Domain of Unknown Function (DUF1080)